jgi:predicted type IV restriction endonuclease
MGGLDMELAAFIQKIQEGLRTGKYVNEAAISQQVLLPLLRKLGWPDDDPEIVRPEYSVGNQRVDYALFHRIIKPVIFIEVKKPGRTEGGDTQLFEYAFQQGIPLAILTDGREWFFYLPGESGEIAERCVYKLDILERDIEESAMRLRRYLEYKRVCEGSAFTDAKADYQDKTKNREIEKTFPRAWRKILETQDSILVDLLAETVADLCGYKPDLETTGRFIINQLRPFPIKKAPSEPSILGDGPQALPPRLSRKRGGEYGFILFGQDYNTENTARGVLVAILEKLNEKDPSFLKRFKSVKHGRERRYVADTTEELYPGNPDLAKDASHFRQLSTGDYVSTNYSKKNIREIIELAAQVAGINFGRDLVVHLGDDEG